MSPSLSVESKNGAEDKMHLRLVHAKLEEMVIKRYKIPFPPDLILGGSVSSGMVEARLDVKWDERYTVLNQALLTATLHGRNDGWPFAPRSFEARLYVNDNLVAARGWMAEPTCGTKTVDTNVGAYFLNGRNRFKLELVASWGPLACGVDAITCDVELWYTGKEPKVTKPPPEWFEKIWPYLKWGLIGVGVVGAVLVAVTLVKKRS